MNYQELRAYALESSLEYHLCNVEELKGAGNTNEDILELIADEDTSVLIYEPYEYYDKDMLVEAIENLRGIYVYTFTHVLSQVNGQEWLINFKGRD